MGLSAEVCEHWVRDCINVKELHRLAAAIEARVEALVAKDAAKASKAQAAK
jgi:hypothetical protein